MQPYTDRKAYGVYCKCFYCRQSRRANKELSRAMKKNARRVGKREASEQWAELLET